MKNLKKLLASALLVCMLVSMLPVSALAEGCAHNYVMTVTANPGCTSVGSASYTCSACENTYNAEIPATGHSYQVTATTAPSCAAAGSTTYTCSHCGDSYVSHIDATGVHTAGEPVTVAASCTAEGSTTVRCTGCGGVLSTTVIPAGHSFSDATCTTAKTCGRCEATEGEPLGHTAGRETVITEATCIDEGSKSMNCTVCGETYTAIIPATGAHIEGAHTVTKEATCEEAGEETVRCATEGCEYSETVEIPALGHKYNEQHLCERCGEKELPMKNAPKSSIEVTSIQIEPDYTALALAPNGTIQLRAVVEPEDATNKTVTWTSSHPDIATVGKDTGVVTGEAKGKATITATANDGSGVSASVDVYVQDDNPYIYVEKSEINIGETAKVRLVYAGDNAPVTVTWSVHPATVASIETNSSNPLEATVTGVAAGQVTNISATYGTGTESTSVGNAILVKSPITGISISGSDSVITGEKITLTATVTSADATDKTVTWKSSDDTIATVDEKGVVTGKKADKVVTITATSKADPTKSASKEITVKAPDLTVSGPGTVAVGKTITLTAKVGPDEVTDKTVTWKSSDETIATVDKDGKVTGKKAGDVKITAASNAYKNLTVEVPVKVTAAVYLYYGNGSHFNGIHPMPFVSSDLWAGGAGVNVIINGVPLVPGRDFSCYSSPHGMIGVTVNPGLLRLLPQNAWHSIEIISANGVAAGSFSTGYFGYYNIYGVKTGDDSTPMLWAALCLLGISGAGIILAKSRKRKA